jgi:predicted CXXCH cytochrome family protein
MPPDPVRLQSRERDHSMKKAIVALAIAGLASTAMAASGIAGGPHDLSNTGGGYGNGLGGLISSCQFCHAPHNTNKDIAAPLWNRNSDAATNTTFAGTFQKYASPTLSNTAGYAPGGGSLTCLSCHDGQTNMGLTFVGTKGFGTNSVTMAGSFAELKKDLTNDHPVGVPYTTANGMKDKATLPAAISQHLYGGSTVECGTCHDPHGEWDGQTGGLSFLRWSAATLCSQCHNK